jgi:hypothetical protein
LLRHLGHTHHSLATNMSHHVLIKVVMCAMQLDLDDVFISKEEIAKDVKEQVRIYQAWSRTLVVLHYLMISQRRVRAMLAPLFQSSI